MTVWGTGTPRREFLHVDDLADAVLYLLQKYDAEPIVNIGWGEDVTIRELAELIVSVIDYSGRLAFDTSKPDGTPRKLLDVERLMELGWRPKIALRGGHRADLSLVSRKFRGRASLESARPGGQPRDDSRVGRW